MSRLPERIGEEVQRTLGRFGAPGAIGKIVEAWPGAVGDSIARNAWPARVSRDGTLHVATSSSAWAYELGLLEDEIRKRLQGALGPDTPPRFRFAPGRLPEAAAAQPQHRPASAPKPSDEDRREAARLTAPIEDENLRKVVAKAAASSLARASERPPRLVD